MQDISPVHPIKYATPLGRDAPLTPYGRLALYVLSGVLAIGAITSLVLALVMG